MGEGWGLTPPTYRRISKAGVTEPKAAEVEYKPATVEDLMAKFNRNRNR